MCHWASVPVLESWLGMTQPPLPEAIRSVPGTSTPYSASAEHEAGSSFSSVSWILVHSAIQANVCASISDFFGWNNSLKRIWQTTFTDLFIWVPFDQEHWNPWLTLFIKYCDFGGRINEILEEGTSWDRWRERKMSKKMRKKTYLFCPNPSPGTVQDESKECFLFLCCLLPLPGTSHRPPPLLPQGPSTLADKDKTETSHNPN